LLVPFALSAIAATVPAVLVIYIAEYIIGTPQWWIDAIPGWLPTWSYYLLLYFVAGIVSLPFWNAVERRIGKRDTWAVGIFLATTTSAGCWWLGDGTIGYFSLLLVFGGFSFGNFSAIPPAMVADVIDFDEVGSGRRREGAYFAIWAFVTKLGGAITGFCTLQVLEHVGYAPGVHQTDFVKLWMLWMYSWFPAALYLASLLTLFRFKFTSLDLADAQRQIGRV
jgi:GPH family glycoside/pentoside/hexuronide:cation symporter